MNLLKFAQNYKLNVEVIPISYWLEEPRKFDNFYCDKPSLLTRTLYKQYIYIYLSLYIYIAYIRAYIRISLHFTYIKENKVDNHQVPNNEE